MCVYVNKYECLFMYIVPAPHIKITVFGYETLKNDTLENISIGDPLTLDCTVSTVRGISSQADVSIIWSTGNEIIRRAVNVMADVKNYSTIYTDSLEIASLSATDNGRAYVCTVLINSSQVLFNVDVLTLIFPGELTVSEIQYS